MTSVVDSDLDFLSRLVQQEAAIVLDSGKKYLLRDRLLPVASDMGFGTLAELCRHLRANPRDARARARVVDAMTTNETMFFRDQAPFDALRTVIVPRLMKQHALTKAFNIWSAACSTGQEPYSIAILLKDHFPELAGWNVRIIATDLSPTVLAKAMKGEYPSCDVQRGLTAEQRHRYFTPVQRCYRICDELRQWVEFRQLNLAATWTFLPTFDVVFIRNVLIYFNLETKQQILRKVHERMRPGGHLFLGVAETTTYLDQLYHRVQIDKAAGFQRV